MRHIFWILFIGAALGAVQPVQAQFPPKKGDFRNKGVEAELEKLRAQVQELEARLKKARPDDAKGDGGGKKALDKKRFEKKMLDGKGPPFGMKKPDGPDGKGPKGPDGKKFEGKGPWGGGSPWAKKGDGKGPPTWAKRGGKGRGFGGPPWARSTSERRSPEATRSFERRLERIIEDLEDLRRDLRKR